MIFDSNLIAESYLNLGNPNPQIQEKANQILLQFQSSPQVWSISKELLTQQTNENLQFLGSQVLYLKIKKEFFNLDESQKNEMREFIFQIIFENDKLSAKALKQLCASGSVIGINMILNGWTTFISDLISIANTSQQKLILVLEIFANLNRELKENDVSQTLRDKVKEALKFSERQITEFLFDIIVSPLQKNDIILMKVFECFLAWVQLRILEIFDYPNLVEELIKSLDNAKAGLLALEILAETTKASIYPDRLLESIIGEETYVLPENVRASIQKIVEFLHQITPALKGLESSAACFQLSELAANLGSCFYVLILENIEYCKVLIKFTLECSSHKNKKISSNTFSYWTFLKSEATSSYDVLALLKQPEYDFVAAAYFELFQIITRNCKAKSLKILSLQEAKVNNLTNVDSEGKEFFEEDSQVDDLSGENLSLQEYRVLSQDVLYSCCVMICLLRDSKGLETLFASIIPILTEEYVLKENLDLTQSKVRADYILTCEVLVFSARSIVEFLSHKTSNRQLEKSHHDKENNQISEFDIYDKYVIEIIKRLILLPREVILLRSGLYFIKYSSKIIKKCIPESLDEILDFCLSIDNPILIEAICECFSALARVVNHQVSVSNLERIANFMDNSILLIEEKKNNLGWISATFHISNCITDNDLKIQFLQKIFNSVEEKFKILNHCLDKDRATFQKDATARNEALKLLNTFLNMLGGTNLEHQESKLHFTQGIEEIVIQFAVKHITYICIYLEIFASEEEFLTLLSTALQNSIRMCKGCSQVLDPYYNQIMTSVLIVFESNPSKNFMLLEIFKTLMLYLENSEEQQHWLQLNFSKFNTFLLNLLSQERLTSILSKWIDILKKVFALYRDFFFSLPEIEDIIKFMLLAFAEPAGTDLLKKISSLLNCFIGTQSTIQIPGIAKYLLNILEITFSKLGEIEDHKIDLLTQLVLSVLSGIEQEDLLVKLFLNALSQEKFNGISEQQKRVFLESMYVHRNNPNLLNVIMKNFSDFSRDIKNNQGSMEYIQLKLLEKQNPAHVTY